jgi:hypothetical protein
MQEQSISFFETAVLKRIPFKKSGRMLLITPREIDWIEAEDIRISPLTFCKKQRAVQILNDNCGGRV